MKIAVLGSASSSVGKAPFKNEKYAQYVEGRIESAARAHAQVSGDWQIWGCSPGCWAVIPRATRWFEVHRWEPEQPWFSPQYTQFLRDFKGIVYTGGVVPEFLTHVVYPIDAMEEKFSSYFMTSSLSLMMALAIDTIEKIREARRAVSTDKAARLAAGSPEPQNLYNPLPHGVDMAELAKDDNDDVIGLWGVDMAANEEYAYQRPGCQFFILEAMRRGIGMYLPPESDLMRPMPVYGISEWDHNYIKLTARARELNVKAQQSKQMLNEAGTSLSGVEGEQHALNYFVQTWTSPYGMMPGMVIRQAPGTGLGSGITSFDGRPIERMNVAQPVLHAMTESPEAQLGRQLLEVLNARAKELRQVASDPESMLRRVFQEADVGIQHTRLLQDFAKPGEDTPSTLKRIIDVAVGKKEPARPGPRRSKVKRRR